jgi:hypothetical protein
MSHSSQQTAQRWGQYQLQERGGPMIRFSTPLWLTLVLPVAALAGPVAGTEAITTQGVTASVDHLASDALEGRGSGERGGRLASDWLAAQCKALGLTPGGDDGTFFQAFSGQGQSMRNVIATIPGTESGEMVVLGAHYDHLGLGHQAGSLAFGAGKGKIHNGADDNASGTGAILEIAKAFVASGKQPRRRVVFVWFDGEERGLLGSAAFVKNIPFADETVVMINLDMVGMLKRDTLKIYGATTGGAVLDGWLEAAKEGSGLLLEKSEIVNSNSDHANFYKKKIPVLVPFTGLHKRYHRPSDDVEQLNMEGITKIARYCYGVAARAANDVERPTFAKGKDGTMEAMMEQVQAMLGGGAEGLRDMLGGGDGKGFDLRRMLGGRGKADRPRLGVTLEGAEGAALVREVHPGTVAERSGLVAGDRIVRFGGEPVDGFPALQRLVRKAKGQVSVSVERGDQQLALVADFGGPKAETPKAPPVKKAPTASPEKSEDRWF